MEIFAQLRDLINLWAFLGAMLYSLKKITPDWSPKAAKILYWICGPIVWLVNSTHRNLHEQLRLEQDESLEKRPTT
jgi:hypothetical protein